jgi:hypothetical protein
MGNAVLPVRHWGPPATYPSKKIINEEVKYEISFDV